MTSSHVHKLRLLVVEDQTGLAANIAEYFSEDKYDLDFCADGLTALHLLSNNTYDVIVLDLMLPGVSGFDICKRIRSDLSCNTPIIIMTARSGIEDKETCFNAGADDYLVKPFPLRELELRVEALERRRNPGTHKLVAESLIFDPSTLHAEHEGKSTTLNGTPSHIFELLIRAYPGFVTQEALCESIWGSSLNEAEGKSLRTHVYTLRQTLTKAFGQAMIKTVYGRGYQLDPPPSKKRVTDK